MASTMDAASPVYVLQYIGMAEYVSSTDGSSHKLICFMNREEAYQFRDYNRLLEMTDIVSIPESDIPMLHQWCKGETQMGLGSISRMRI